MKFGSDCSGPCEDCGSHYIAGCLAGHGDDDFWPITLEKAKKIIANPAIDEFRKDMLRKRFPELVSGEI